MRYSLVRLPLTVVAIGLSIVTSVMGAQQNARSSGDAATNEGAQATPPKGKRRPKSAARLSVETGKSQTPIHIQTDPLPRRSQACAALLIMLGFTAFISF